MGQDLSSLNCCRQEVSELEIDNREKENGETHGKVNVARGQNKYNFDEEDKQSKQFAVIDLQDEPLKDNLEVTKYEKKQKLNMKSATPGGQETITEGKPQLNLNSDNIPQDINEQSPDKLEENDSIEINKGVNRNLILRSFLRESVIKREADFGKPFSKEYAIEKGNLNVNTLQENFANENDQIYDHGSLVAGKSFYFGERNKALNRNGYGTLYLMDGSKYEGFWINNELSLYGRHIDNELNVFEGEFQNGNLHGDGVESSGAAYFRGKFINGVKYGKGVMESENEVYEGDFENGVKNGFGKIHFIKTKNYYEGQFINGKIEGEGMFKWQNNDTYVGTFDNGVLNGQGIYNWNNGDVYTGTYVDGMRSGYGKLQNVNGKIYEGQFENNLPHGKGVIIKEGKVSEVEFVNGVPTSSRKRYLKTQQ